MIAELLRKSIHLSGLILPVIYYIFLDKPTMLILMGILTGFALAVELVKWLSPPFGEFFFRIFASLLRTHERKGGNNRRDLLSHQCVPMYFLIC